MTVWSSPFKIKLLLLHLLFYIIRFNKIIDSTKLNLVIRVINITKLFENIYNSLYYSLNYKIALDSNYRSKYDIRSLPEWSAASASFVFSFFSFSFSSFFSYSFPSLFALCTLPFNFSQEHFGFKPLPFGKSRKEGV